MSTESTHRQTHSACAGGGELEIRPPSPSPPSYYLSPPPPPLTPRPEAGYVSGRVRWGWGMKEECSCRLNLYFGRLVTVKNGFHVSKRADKIDRFSFLRFTLAFDS
jgi:hypothetical protein